MVPSPVAQWYPMEHQDHQNVDMPHVCICVCYTVDDVVLGYMICPAFDP